MALVAFAAFVMVAASWPGTDAASRRSTWLRGATLAAASSGTARNGATVLAAAESDGQLWDKVQRVATLRDYNTRIVLLGTVLLGIGAGTVGSMLLMRKRSLLGDVVGHAALPGVAAAFLLLHIFGASETRSLPLLMVGATISGSAGALATVAIRRWTRIKEDAALAITLSVLFGFGVVLLSIVQKLAVGGQAGLHQFIYGQTASLRAADVQAIGGGSLLVTGVCLLLFKEFALLCFDERFARTQGWPATLLDIGLMGLAVAISVIGMQSVGLLLVVALLVIPASAARFWTDQLGRMTAVSALIGAAAAAVGVFLSALAPDLSAGALIVLSGTAFFIISLLGGTKRGLAWRWMARWSTQRRVGRHDLLRAMFECVEPSLDDAADPIRAMTEHCVSTDDLRQVREWAPGRLNRLLLRAVDERLVRQDFAGGFRLTRAGAFESRRVARNHRLWELYLIHYADIAPSHVDRDADMIEHVIDPALWDELNRLLAAESPALAVPASPHELSR